jgi:demethylmenaquinone methyltransferase/2-methoxy-6-polyprenyl-1,4-benzoquinol methylase
VPFQATFSCLWCGRDHVTRSRTDLEGWAQLCPDCIGRAGDNGFLRFRLRQALADRSAAERAGPVAADDAGSSRVDATLAATPSDPIADLTAPATDLPAPAADAGVDRTGPATDPERSMIEYYDARAPEYDDWYLRRGRYARGAIHDAAWHAELDAAGRWLDARPWGGEIVELAAGTGWWSPLLAGRGELSLYDASPAALDRARERLLAHGLRAHLHVRDAWAEPDREVNGLFLGFWLSHIPRARLAEFLALAARWLRPAGRLAFIDSLADPLSGAADHPPPADDRAVRRLDDGREFTIVKVYYRPDELSGALRAAGFDDVDIGTTGRFFLLGSARRAVDRHHRAAGLHCR